MPSTNEPILDNTQESKQKGMCYTTQSYVKLLFDYCEVTPIHNIHIFLGELMKMCTHRCGFHGCILPSWSVLQHDLGLDPLVFLPLLSKSAALE